LEQAWEILSRFFNVEFPALPEAPYGKFNSRCLEAALWGGLFLCPAAVPAIGKA
jgi:hypothetical protein